MQRLFLSLLEPGVTQTHTHTHLRHQLVKFDGLLWQKYDEIKRVQMLILSGGKVTICIREHYCV